MTTAAPLSDPPNAEPASVSAPALTPHSGPKVRRRASSITLQSALIALAVLGGFAALFAAGYLPKQRQRAALEAAALHAAAEAPQVSLVEPRLQNGERPFVIPGTVQALERANVFSRASGFVARWHADMGDRVSAGQLLLELETPELDQELEQARANLAESAAVVSQAEATSAYSASTLARYELLLKEGLSSHQELAQRQAQAAIDIASLRVARAKQSARVAELHRLQQLKAFARVSSPFAGAVSARYVERGTLVTAGSNTALFEVVATDVVRVLVQIPQSRVRGIQPGLAAEVSVNEYPEASFTGSVTRSAGTLDPAARSMNVEVLVPNPEGKLLPGMYASVSLKLTSTRRPFVLPSSALIAQGSGFSVAQVDEGGKVRLVPIEIERDYGSEVEIKRGIQGGERLIGAPGPSLVEGQLVRYAP